MPETQEGAAAVRHLYVHVPFCHHRCGYCDFVTAIGRHSEHAAYVDALLVEYERERFVLAEQLDTVFLGGGTPTYLEPRALARLLSALPAASEITIEANPETVTPALAELLVDHGVTRVSLGAQTFDSDLLATLERQATPSMVRAAFATLRDAGFANLSLDLIYGIPGQRAEQLDHDLSIVLELGPEHVSVYELEAKQGTRFTRTHGPDLARQAERLEEYMDAATARLQSAGYRWYETANFCRVRPADVRELRSLHNLGYWLGHDYLGIGVGAVSTVGRRRWKNAPSVARYVSALENDVVPARTTESLTDSLRLWETTMLGLRLDEPLDMAVAEPVLDPDGLERMKSRQLVEHADGAIRLTRRGRLLANGVTVELLRELEEGGDSGASRASEHSRSSLSG